VGKRAGGAGFAALTLHEKRGKLWGKEENGNCAPSGGKISTKKRKKKERGPPYSGKICEGPGHSKEGKTQERKKTKLKKKKEPSDKREKGSWAPDRSFARDQIRKTRLLATQYAVLFEKTWK